MADLVQRFYLRKFWFSHRYVKLLVPGYFWGHYASEARIGETIDTSWYIHIMWYQRYHANMSGLCAPDMIFPHTIYHVGTCSNDWWFSTVCMFLVLTCFKHVENTYLHYDPHRFIRHLSGAATTSPGLCSLATAVASTFLGPDLRVSSRIECCSFPDWASLNSAKNQIQDFSCRL